MLLLFASFVAGILTGLAPCILPILPIVMAGSVSESKNAKRPLIIIGSLSASIIIFTLLLRQTTRVLDISDDTLATISGVVIIVVGLFTLFPLLWDKMTVRLNIASQKKLGKAQSKKSITSAILTGLALGPIFISCSPTYGLITTSVLPGSFWRGFINLIVYTLGLALFLLLITNLGQSLVNKLNWATNPKGWFRRIMGLVFVIIGVAIMFSWEKRVETWLLNNSDIYRQVIQFEDGLIEDERNNLQEDNDREQSSSEDPISNVDLDNLNSIQSYISQSFSTDLAKSNINDWGKVLSGNVGKDGIPPIDNPKFTDASETEISNDQQGLLVKIGDKSKFYPYQILFRHEIVNDELNGQPISITFCPLCGSGIVFNRELGSETLDFGVSGLLRESNLIMYDRQTESLWQQSIGKGLVGQYTDEQLEFIDSQLLTLEQAVEISSDLEILSADTGFNIDYNRLSYPGYNENDDYFIFRPSSLNERFPSKEIFQIVNTGEQSIAIRRDNISTNKTLTHPDPEVNLEITIDDIGLITATIASGKKLPSYFEMWFSWAVQHENSEDAVVWEP